MAHIRSNKTILRDKAEFIAAVFSMEKEMIVVML